MKEFIVKFSDGLYDDFWEGDFYLESKCKDDLEYKLLECNGEIKQSENTTLYFKAFYIYTLEEWKKQNKIEL